MAPPAPHYPVWVDRHRGPAVLWLLAWLVTVAVLAAGALAGWWFLPFVAGLAAGVAAHYGRWRLRVTLPATVLGAAAGWGAALWWLVRRGLPEGPVAREIAALAGLPAQRAGRHRRHLAGSGHPGAGGPVAGPCPDAGARIPVTAGPAGPGHRRGHPGPGAPPGRALAGPGTGGSRAFRRARRKRA